MFERFLVRLFRGCANRPLWTLAFLLAASASSIFSLRYLKFADLFESFFSGASDEWGYYNELTRSFVTDQIVAVGLEPQGELFTKEYLELIRGLSKKLVALEHVESITDLTSVDYFEEGDERFSSKPLLPDDIPGDHPELMRIKRRALDEPLYVGGIISVDGGTAAIHVRVADGVGTDERSALAQAIARTVDEHMAARPTWRVAITGDPWFTHYHQTYMERDLAVLTPLTMVLLFIVMLLVLRRFWGATLALLGCGLFMAMAVALLVLTRGTMNGCTTMIPPFAFVIAVTVVIHFLNELRLNSLRYPGRTAALDHTISDLAAPVFYANVSTAIGFFSLAVSSIPAIIEFGVAMGVGMVVIVFVLMAYCSAIARLVPTRHLIAVDPRKAEQNLTSVRVFERLGAHVFAHRGAWLAVVFAVSAVTLYGATKIRIETNLLEMFHERDPLFQDAVYYGNKFGGVSTLYVAIDGAEPGYLKTPGALADIEKIEHFLTTDLKAGYTFSITKFVKTMQRAFFGGDPARYAIPPQREQVAQLLLINTDDTINDVVNEDYSRGVIVAWINEHSSTRLLEMKRRTDEFLEGMSRESVRYRLSGTLMLDTQLTDAVARSTFLSFLLAIAIIFALRLVQFGHFYLGLLSLLPNAFPIWTTFGVMGLLGIPLNISTAMSATVTLGIADDETIHFFASYQAKRKEGKTPRQAILLTLTDKGSSIYFSTVIVILGFSALLFSNYGPTMWFGIVLSISLVVAIFANLVFAPALLDLTRPIRDPVPTPRVQPPSS